MIDPINIALISLCLVLAGLCLFLRQLQKRERERLNGFYDEVVEVASNASFGKRVPVERASDDLAALGKVINQLFDAINDREQEALARDTLFQDLANAMPDVVLVHGDKIHFANTAASELLGIDAKHLTGHPMIDLVRPAYRTRFRNNTTALLKGDADVMNEELQLVDGHKGSRSTESRSVAVSYRGQPSVLTIARDVTYRKSVEASLGRSKHQAQVTLESIADGVITTDTNGVIDYLNSAAQELTGASAQESVGKRLSDIVKLVDETDRRDLGDPVSQCLISRKRISLGRRALMVSLLDDKELSVEVTASPVASLDGSVSGSVIMIRDVSELRGLTARMSYQAAHDGLTGLINRREFERQVSVALQASSKDSGSHVLCFLDLDRFKTVNDTCGHQAGDLLLREISSLVKEQVRDSDYVGRLGGDEFGMLLVGCPLKKARQIADDVCEAVRTYRFVWQDKIFSIGVSVGLVEIGPDSTSVEDVLSAADSACYLAKEHGRGRVHVYSAKDEAGARQRGEIQWLQKLQAALKNDHFELFTQPIISMGGRVPNGPAVEIFLRLKDDDGSLIPPANFIRAAERYRLMGSVDRWVVGAALASLSQGGIRLPDERSCSINLSGQTMTDEGFLEYVIDCLDHSQIDPSRICFEITESAVIGNLENAKRFIGVLHGMGCTFGLDDFGSGIGALSSLQGLDVDYVKIDGEYTRNLGANTVNQEVVGTITRLSKAVGFKVVAEQVEDQSSFDSLRDLGVNFIQGNYVEEPSSLGSDERSSTRD